MTLDSASAYARAPSVIVAKDVNGSRSNGVMLAAAALAASSGASSRVACGLLGRSPMSPRYYGYAAVKQRGMALIEVLIVVAIMSLIAATVATAAYEYFKRARIESTLTNARTIRHGVKAWWTLHGSTECPTFSQLVGDAALDEDSPRRDSWGIAWRIECTDDRVTVSSNGPDREAGTDDDLRVPPPT